MGASPDIAVDRLMVRLCRHFTDANKNMVGSDGL